MESKEHRIQRIMRLSEEHKKRFLEVERDKLEAEKRNASVTKVKRASTNLSDMMPAERDAYLNGSKSAYGDNENADPVMSQWEQKNVEETYSQGARKNSDERSRRYWGHDSRDSPDLQTNERNHNNTRSCQRKQTRGRQKRSQMNSFIVEAHVDSHRGVHRRDVNYHQQARHSEVPQTDPIVSPYEAESNDYPSDDEGIFFTDIAPLDPTLPVDPQLSDLPGVPAPWPAGQVNHVSTTPETGHSQQTTTEPPFLQVNGSTSPYQTENNSTHDDRNYPQRVQPSANMADFDTSHSYAETYFVPMPSARHSSYSPVMDNPRYVDSYPTVTAQQSVPSYSNQRSSNTQDVVPNFGHKTQLYSKPQVQEGCSCQSILENRNRGYGDGYPAPAMGVPRSSNSPGHQAPVRQQVRPQEQRIEHIQSVSSGMVANRSCNHGLNECVMLQQPPVQNIPNGYDMNLSQFHEITAMMSPSIAQLNSNPPGNRHAILSQQGVQRIPTAPDMVSSRNETRHLAPVASQQRVTAADYSFTPEVINTWSQQGEMANPRSRHEADISRISADDVARNRSPEMERRVAGPGYYGARPSSAVFAPPQDVNSSVRVYPQDVVFSQAGSYGPLRNSASDETLHRASSTQLAPSQVDQRVSMMPEHGVSLRSGDNSASSGSSSSPKEAMLPPGHGDKFLKGIDFSKPPPSLTDRSKTRERISEESELMGDTTPCNEYGDLANYTTINHAHAFSTLRHSRSDTGYESQCLDSSEKDDAFLADEMRDMWPTSNDSSSARGARHIPPVMSSTPYAPVARPPHQVEVSDVPMCRPILGRGASTLKDSKSNESSSDYLPHRPSFVSGDNGNDKPLDDEQTGNRGQAPAIKKSFVQLRMEAARNDNSKRWGRNGALKQGGVVEYSWPSDFQKPAELSKLKASQKVVAPFFACEDVREKEKRLAQTAAQNLTQTIDWASDNSFDECV